MNARKRIFHYIGGIVFLGVIVGVGYMPERNDAHAEGVSSNVRIGDQPFETLTLAINNIVARGIIVDVSHVHVDLFTQQGFSQFSVDIAKGSEQDETLRWTLHGSPPTIGSLQMRIDLLPSLREAITVALLLHTNVSNAAFGQEYDNWGCDSLFGIEMVNSCGPKGACCDEHDACYAANSCTASSWLPGSGSSECKQCNKRMVHCYFNESPGPSECCTLNNCGQPR